MKNRLIILICMFLTMLDVPAQKKHAFIVGISNYECQHNGWLDIHGENDKKIISNELSDQDFYIYSVNSQTATYNHIKSAFKTFCRDCSKGDIVYIHFSTHGQPVKDEDGDELDGWDEAIVPIDAPMFYDKGKYEGEHHLTDDELSKMLNQLRKILGPNGIVYLVIDACHAGTMSRDEDDDPVRGTNSGFSRDGSYYKPQIIEKSCRYNIQKDPRMANIVVFEACRPYQRNKEIKVGNDYYGPLSYYIAQALKQVKLDFNPASFSEIVKNGMKNVQGQDMVIETTFVK